MIKKYFSLFIFLLVTGFFTFTFSGCSDDEDFADAVAYYQNDDSGLGKITLAFYDDSTFELHKKYERPQKTDGKTIIEDYSIATGTYSGSVTTDGTVTCTYNKAVAETLTLSPNNNSRFLGLFEDEETYGNDKFPLQTFDEPISKSYTISSGKITYEPIDGIPLNNLNISGWKLDLTKQE